MIQNPLRYIWLLLGFLTLGLGTAGVVLPVLPTVPFYMATVFCFTKSSPRLHKWFVGTKLYEKHLDSFVRDKTMTIGTKLRISVTVTTMMGISFLLMKNVPIGRVVLAGAWVWHLWYFFLHIETVKPEADILNRTEKKRKKEQRVVGEMIALYCHKQHGTDKRSGLCAECKELLSYAQTRSEKCPFMEEKTFCSNCRVHCYRADMRERIRAVMRFSGPRMLWYHPILALWHVISAKLEKNRLKKEQKRNGK